MKKNISLLFFALVIASSPITQAEETISIGLKEVVNIALKNNLNLKIERISPEIQQNSLIVEESVFDPNLVVEGSTLKQEPDNAATGSQLNQTTFQASVSKRFSPGTSVAVNLTVTDDDNETAGTKFGGNETTTSLVITQPLLKNRGRMVNQRNIALTGYNLKIAELSFKQSVIDTVVEAKSLYWKYYSSLELLEVQKQSLTLAQRLNAEMEEKVRLGSTPRLDLLQSKAEVASREGEVISAERDVYNNRDNLLNYIYGGLTTFGKVICKDSPSFEAVTVDEEEMQKTTLNHRTDYLTADYAVQSSQVDLVYFKNQQLPALDISGTLGINDGKTDNTGSTGYQDYSYGMVKLSIDLPIGFRKDKTNYASARLSNKQRKIALENTKNQVILDLRKTIRDMRAAYKSYQAIALARNLAEKSLEVEEGKFRHGLSTSYNVHLNQRDLSNARANEVNAAVNYQLTVIALYKAAGITLEKNSIEINEVSK